MRIVYEVDYIHGCNSLNAQDLWIGAH